MTTPPTSTPRRRGSALRWLLALLVAVGGVAGGWWFTTGPGATTVVPTVVGRQADAAETALTGASLVADTSEEFWVRFGTFAGTDPESGTSYADEEDFHVVAAPDDADVEPDVVVDGAAAALDLWLWSRGDDTDVSVVGDHDVLARFRAIVDSPIN